MASTQLATTHLSSAFAVEQGKNVFIWCMRRKMIVLSWRINNDTPTTITQAHHWIDTAIKDDEHAALSEEHLGYSLFPVTVKPRYKLTYTPSRKVSAAAFPHESKEILIVGDYGIFKLDTSFEPIAYPFKFLAATFMQVVSELEGPDTRFLVKPSDSLERMAEQRDKSRCIFTGARLPGGADAVEVTWFLPLNYDYLMKAAITGERSKAYLETYDDMKSHERLMNICNCLITTKEIKQLLWEHKLAIDVDDDFRIVYFPIRTPNTPQFKSHLVRSGGPDDLAEEYLRAHFRRSLLMNIVGGDVTEDYPNDGWIQEFAEDMDVECGSDPDLTRPEWDSKLGRQALQWLRECKASAGQ
ncbi:hypothetical protein Hypma_004093 [Hypsizygus marmoreus]|uniref:Uncharacterized protein n=1 Tax=Hypsizygus marmoreus TaxID=39966 RepID=A0A369K1K7_HYPMA|nr:hypothetical protein Hypma_004093 [Hypsizygus marmoreus]